MLRHADELWNPLVFFPSAPVKITNNNGPCARMPILYVVWKATEELWYILSALNY